MKIVVRHILVWSLAMWIFCVFRHTQHPPHHTHLNHQCCSEHTECAFFSSYYNPSPSQML